MSSTTISAPASGLLEASHAPALGAAVPFARMDCADPELLEELLGAVREVAERGAFTLGEYVDSFERDFAAYCETEFAVGVSSGTEALVLALRALEVGPGDEVIVPTNSFIATAEAVSAVGATPRLVDVDPDTHLLTAEILQGALGPRVRCVIPVHLFGATVEVDPILALAAEAGVPVIEDACQAHGARYHGRRVGGLGTLGCFSFYPAKNLGAWGDGGAVVTNDPELDERLRLLRSHGERPRYNHRIVGGTARLDALQAAILRRKLTRLDGWNEQRRQIAAELRARLAGVGEGARSRARSAAEARPGVRSAAQARSGAASLALDLPAAPQAGGDHVHHLFVVRCERREELREHLAQWGVASGIHYPTPIHLTEAYAHLGQDPGSLPVAEALAGQICSLPIFPGMGGTEIDRVCDAVFAFFTQDAGARAR